MIKLDSKLVDVLGKGTPIPKEFVLDVSRDSNSSLITFFNCPDPEKGFSLADLVVGMTACTIDENMRVSKGTLNMPLVGKVVEVIGACYKDTMIPIIAQVMVRGLLRLQSSPNSSLGIGDQVVVDGQGFVRGLNVNEEHLRPFARGIVICVEANEENWVNVLI